MSGSEGRIAPMHANERPLDAAFVRRLLAGQFPALSGLPLSPVPSLGSDNAMYRLGDELLVRLPRWRPSEAAGVRLEKEVRWLPWLAPRLPLPIPAVVEVGEPADGYPFSWAVFRWLEGDPARLERSGDQERAAADLARFLGCLQAVDPTGGPAPGPHNAFRGVPLGERDRSTREAIHRSVSTVESAPILAAWEEAVSTPEWEGAPRWIHGDLDVRNLLVRDGRLSAVVDFGCLGVGDPACDAMAAWKLFPARPRELFRRELGADDATWARARGWAISQAMGALSYYTERTNPVLIAEARRWLAEALAD